MASTGGLVGGVAALRRGAATVGTRLRNLPTMNPATASPAMTIPVTMAMVRSGSDVGRIFSLSIGAATRRELRGGGPASVVVATPVVVGAA